MNLFSGITGHFQDLMSSNKSDAKPHLISDSPFLAELDLRPSLRRSIDEMEPENVFEDFYQAKAIPMVISRMVGIIKENADTSGFTANELKARGFVDFLISLFGEKRLNNIFLGIASPKSDLTPFEQHLLMSELDTFKNDPEFLCAQFYSTGIFTGLLLKGQKGRDILDGFARCQKTIPDNNLIIATSVLPSVSDYPGFEDTLYHQLDQWTTQHWETQSVKKMIQANPRVADALVDYLRLSSKRESAFACSLIKRLDSLEPALQLEIWQELYDNSTPEKRRNVIHTFLQDEHLPACQKIFYSYFVKNVSETERQSILGSASEKVQQRYWRLLKQLNIDLTRIKIKDIQQPQNFLAWHLFNKQKITAPDMLELIQQTSTRSDEVSSKTFLFHKKQQMTSEVFLAGCKKMQNSPFDFLRWIASYKNTDGFASWLATQWSALPDSIRKNTNIVLSMDNHFGLMYQLAQRGDTGMLNEIKNVLAKNPDEYAKRLIHPHREGDTILHTLCRQSKKGILNVLDVLPKAKQDQLLYTQNMNGQTPLDCCSSDFYRYMTEHTFARPKVIEETNTEVQEVAEPVQVEKNPVVEKVSPSKRTILRSEVLLPRFKRDQAKLSTVPGVLKSAQNEIYALRTMNPVQLQLRMQEDCKRSIINKPCVADFHADGNAYRMGYVVENDVVSFLFLMTHQQYDNELQNKRNKRMSKLTALGRKMARQYQD